MKERDKIAMEILKNMILAGATASKGTVLSMDVRHAFRLADDFLEESKKG